jgi:transposase
MEKSRRVRYTHEVKLEALRMVGAGKSIAAVAAILGISSQTLHNWIKTQQSGRLTGAGVRVSPEQMEFARLRAELSKTRMELAIVKKAAPHCSKTFQDALKAYGMRSSMSRKADCWDNAPPRACGGRSRGPGYMAEPLRRGRRQKLKSWTGWRFTMRPDYTRRCVTRVQ